MHTFCWTEARSCICILLDGARNSMEKPNIISICVNGVRPRGFQLIKIFNHSKYPKLDFQCNHRYHFGRAECLHLNSNSMNRNYISNYEERNIRIHQMPFANSPNVSKYWSLVCEWNRWISTIGCNKFPNFIDTMLRDAHTITKRVMKWW